MKVVPKEDPEPPYIALLRDEGLISHKLHIGDLNKDDITELVLALGFFRKSSAEDPDPEEYGDGIPSTTPDGSTADRLARIQRTGKFSGVVEKLTPRRAEDVVSLDRIVDLKTYNDVRMFLGRVRSLRHHRDEL
ncbi:uncharacterized protein LOC143288052 [Babylonia areolata]|uniref:uncharacterized protein LOC143288052 n=1 Tax=Babylonia areolata TaxID=304850 RepID=UPI003FD4BCFB